MNPLEVQITTLINTQPVRLLTMKREHIESDSLKSKKNYYRSEINLKKRIKRVDLHQKVNHQQRQRRIHLMLQTLQTETPLGLENRNQHQSVAH